MNKNQRGMTLIGMIFIAAIVGCMFLVAAKIVPHYIEFSGVKKVIKDLGEDPNVAGMNKPEVMKLFDRKASAGYVTAVNGRDLIFAKAASGKPTISVEYEVVEPIVANLSALIDFKASTED